MIKKLNIALLAGGDSSEREISLKSAGQVAAALDKSKYNVTTIDIRGRSWSYTDVATGEQFELDKNDFSLTVRGTQTIFEYALILIHGTPGEDGRLQGYLDIMGVPYSSSGMVASVVTFDKVTCKRAVASSGINLAREILVRRGDTIDPEEVVRSLGLPLFVKPNASGSSFGVTKVNLVGEVVPAIEAAFGEGDAVLIEECITGREVGCGVMVVGGQEYVFPITEIISSRDFFDYQAKYTSGLSTEITPAEIDPAMKKLLGEMTLNIYRSCNCSGVVRVDFIIREGDNRPYMIEVNSVPGMSQGSIVPQQVAAMGMTLGELFDIIIKDSYVK